MSDQRRKLVRAHIAKGDKAEPAPQRTTQAVSSRDEARRYRLRAISDANLEQLRREVADEQRRRRRVHDHDPTDRIRVWRPCAICGSRSCVAEICREAERQLARRFHNAGARS
jgi:hypothetical protein